MTIVGALVSWEAGDAMKRYAEHAAREREARRRFSRMLWTAGPALVVVVVLIVALSNPEGFHLTPGVGILLAVLLLAFRQLGRRMQNRNARAAQPDPKSTLKLN
jgi:hypothetical protein